MAGIFGGGDSAQTDPNIYGDQLPYPNAPAYDGGTGGGLAGAGYPYPNAPSYSTGAAGGDYGYVDPSNNYAYSTDAGGGGGGLFGGLGDWLSSEKGQRALQQLQGFSSGLLQGSAPSLQPRNFATGLGMGMQGMQQAGSQYYTDALRRAQAQEAQAKVANLGVWDKTLQGYAANATGLPPGYGAGMPGSGSSSTPAVAIPPPSAGGDPAGTGLFAQYAPVIQKYENASGNPNAGYGGEDLSKYPLSATGFPQWAGKMGPAGNSTAAGLYQITRSTWDPVAQQLGVKDFSPESQYKVAEALYAQRGLDPWLPYNKNLAAAIGRGEAPNPFGQPPAGMPAMYPIPAPGQPAPAAAGTVAAAPPGLAARFPNIAAARPGLLPTPAPVPAAAITSPAAAAASVAPAGTVPPTAATAPLVRSAAVTTAAPGGWLAVGDSIARGFVQKAGLAGKTALDRSEEGYTSADAAAGRNPQEVLDYIKGAAASDPDYFRGKNVVLSTGVSNGPDQIDRVPAQIAALKAAGAANVQVVGVGNRAGKEAGQSYNLAPYNRDLQNMAQQANDKLGGGVGFTGALPAVVHPRSDYYAPAAAKLARAGTPDTGGGGGPGGAEIAPVPVNPEPAAAGNVPGAVPAAVAPPAVAPAATAPPAPPITAGPMSTPVAAAPALPAARPISLPGGTPYGALPPAAPAPDATAPPGPPPPPVPPVTAAPGGPAAAIPAATAGARPPVPMPAVIQAQPLPLPNLPQPGSAGVPGLPPYDVEAARRAQVLAIAGAATGHQVPAYLADQANLPNKALAQQWEMQKTLYGAQLTAVSDQWKAANDAQKEAIAAQNGLTKAGYESTLRTQENEWDKGRMIGPDGRVMLRPGFTEAEAGKAGAIKGAELAPQLSYDVLKDYNTIREVKGVVPSGPNAGAPTTRNVSQATLDAEAGRPPPPAVAAAMGQPPAPVPGAIAAGAPGGTVTGLSPQQTARIEGDKADWQTVSNQHTQANNLRPLLDQVINMANKTPSGWAVPVTQFVADGFKAFGIPVTEGMSNAEVMRTVSQALIPTVRQPGSQSNAEMTNYLNTVPGLAQSPAGRIQIANMNKAMIDRLGEIAEVRRSNLGADDLQEKLAALDAKPLFNPQQKAVMVAAMGQRPPTDAEFDLLPIGIDYTNRQGQRKTKLANRTPAQ